jgi:RNA polymerase sigma factor (sigma-70 family)
VWHDADHEAIEVWDAVRALPPRQRLAIALRYGAGCTEAEVATAMGIAVGTASATLVAARRSLAVALGEPSEDEDD